MKIRSLIPIIISIGLGIVLAVTACTQPTSPVVPVVTPTPAQTAATTVPAPAPATVTQIVEKDKVYNCLSPQGIQPSVEIKPLAARLDTLDGKVVYVNQGEADPIIMPALWERVKKDYPKTNWKYIATSSFGPSSLEAEVTASAKAVIRGIAW